MKKTVRFITAAAMSLFFLSGTVPAEEAAAEEGQTESLQQESETEEAWSALDYVTLCDYKNFTRERLGLDADIDVMSEDNASKVQIAILKALIEDCTVTGYPDAFYAPYYESAYSALAKKAASGGMTVAEYISDAYGTACSTDDDVKAFIDKKMEGLLDKELIMIAIAENEGYGLVADYYERNFSAIKAGIK